MMLWYMASSCTFRQLATYFDVSESTAVHSVHALIELTVDHLQDKVICWPTEEEATQISNMFEEVTAMNIYSGSHVIV